MKKTALHFKIASWSIRHPGMFYAVGLLVLLCFIGLGALVVPSTTMKALDSPNPLPARAIVEKSNTASSNGWVPVKDMELPDGVKCRLYKRDGTSITNCYRLRNGVWSFDQSF